MAPSNARKSSGTPQQPLLAGSRDDGKFEEPQSNNAGEDHDVFIDPMLGHSLSFFVHEDITSRPSVVEAIKVYCLNTF